MKKITVAIMSLLVASTFSLSALAAQEITKEEAKQYQEVGKVSTNNEYSSPAEAMAEISKKADEMGGKYFVITSGKEGKKIQGTATVYK
ncbi:MULTISPECIES: YdgH/BhsA/McbA-like domain containing protein [Pantoea]|jgi:Protein of unknown function (DUF1471).|uniref:YdgH/BhsA/McbA-like domain containing protein n=2 Tax=Erwiniaceae TaxID=1903409 RepID=UPI0007364E0D|nr:MULTISPECIES: YdgH/BhsA/McbA-like domain containing protein [Pantoea]MBK4769442.1 DUF1471 domain-containing protein [Pantoea sp. Morm]KAA8674007.1 DUF1471 domain-containing protein [Pantoea dispersa]KAF0856269.1 hypothetical protein Y788_07185 [Pantoea dispersa 625]KTS17076.1 hypothetical protein NS215_09435 [Pantoea dispersa]KTS88608.1 hypothetical protein RSA31_08580 [Pantoea dispersa]